LAVSPESDEKFELDSLVGPSASDDVDSESEHEDVELRGCHRALPSAKSLISELPEILVSIASQPILKGYCYGGVVGNVKEVLRARIIIYAFLKWRASVPNNWEKEVGAPSTLLSRRELKTIPALLCPKCKGPI
jgi:hypothetical protein